MNKLIPKKREIYNKYNEIDLNNQEYNSIINIYSMALNRVKYIVEEIKNQLNKYSGYEVIHDTSSRIKSYDSIINKMKKKKLECNCSTLIENINDIAGIRIVSMSEDDIYKIVKIISNINEFNILKEKNYIKNKKKSGYSAYHMIIEVPVYVENEKVWVKVEIQIRTIGMDFWSVLEHRVKYKSNKKLSKKDSSKLKIYANIISKIGRDMSRMYRNSYKCIEN